MKLILKNILISSIVALFKSETNLQVAAVAAARHYYTVVKFRHIGIMMILILCDLNEKQISDEQFAVTQKKFQENEKNK